MSDNKELNKQITDYAGVLKQIKSVKKKAKRQRDKMRKRGIRLVQDYCN